MSHTDALAIAIERYYQQTCPDGEWRVCPLEKDHVRIAVRWPDVDQEFRIDYLDVFAWQIPDGGSAKDITIGPECEELPPPKPLATLKRLATYFQHKRQHALAKPGRGQEPGSEGRYAPSEPSRERQAKDSPRT